MALKTFMVVGTIRPDTDMAELGALVPHEVARIAELREEGRVGAVHVSQPRRTVFIETFASDETDAVTMVQTLPLARFLDLDIFATTPPGVAGNTGA